METLLKSEDALRQAAEALALTLTRGTEAAVVALHGELGAGKTAFVQALARHWGVADRVVSPTFLLERVYDLPQGPFERLVHIDAYRLEGAEDLAPLGWEGIKEDPGNLICIEWAERVSEALPEHTVHLTLSHAPSGRKLAYGS